jgi:hypothetical protein
MPHPHLRVYFGPEDTTNESVAARATPPVQQVTVQLSEILPALADAVASQRGWLQDFADDSVTISTDLYEVLLAYQELRATG